MEFKVLILGVNILLSCACYIKSQPEGMNGSVNKIGEVFVLPAAIDSNETKHGKDMAFSCSSHYLKVLISI